MSVGRTVVARGVVRLPRFCLWFLGDFGWSFGLRQFCREFDVIPPDASPRVRFGDSDWERVQRKFGRRP